MFVMTAQHGAICNDVYAITADYVYMATYKVQHVAEL